MSHTSGIEAFLSLRGVYPVLDVRSPGEYAHGHIPGAISFPLFSNEERAAVGTAYKQVGKDTAFELGLRFVGPKMESFVVEAKKLAPDRKLAIHCWRGGQRSGAMAWLLRQAGFEVTTLQGGYKAYRNHVLQAFEDLPLKLVVLGGKTGSGKTKVLKAMAKLGVQVIDLEGLANHKGSAFGFIGEQEQPTVEHFENTLYDEICAQDLSKPIWIENESHSIGRIFIPEPFWQKKQLAPLVNLEIPLEDRIANLLEDYTITNLEDLQKAFLKIERKLGGQNLKMALDFLEKHDFEGAAKIALNYYDKTYQFGLETTEAKKVFGVLFPNGRAEEIAKQLAALQIYSTD